MQIVIIACAFACAAALAGAVWMLFTKKSSTEMEDRLDVLTSGPSGSAITAEKTNLLSYSREDARGFADALIENFFDINRFLSQADMSLSASQFLVLTIASGAIGGFGWVLSPLPIAMAPLAVIVCSVMPFLFALIKRKRRLGKFASQLPDALELISRALRAGHSLASGFNLVGGEMAEPICTEFARCYEQQNLGIPLDEALEGMTQRVPNLDLRFFSTAVVLQRQTGGDLAEILDKIGHLVRERFKIYGQIQALTGEGRLSGIVLLSLPPVLFVVMYRLNSEYVNVLFSDPVGQQLLGGAIFLQLIGALVIKKIITIKV
ncbi:MAG: type II secretion system F family protein [Pirellulaceae bacterium]|nr:type II secretion system F family protein [Pirellulaceae bacterium]